MKSSYTNNNARRLVILGLFIALIIIQSWGTLPWLYYHWANCNDYYSHYGNIKYIVARY